MLCLALGARRKARGDSADSGFRSLEDTDAGRERPGLRLLPLLTPSRPENETAGNERERIGPKRNEPPAQKAKAQVERRVRFPAAPQQKALGVGVLCAAGGLRLLAALGRVGGDPLEQCVECGLLLGVKGRKHALFCGSECVLYLCQSARSCRREAHRMAAPVLRGASALD
jgi:hypothetical protein